MNLTDSRPHNPRRDSPSDGQKMLHVVRNRGLIPSTGCYYGCAVFPFEALAMDHTTAAVEKGLQLGTNMKYIVGAGENEAIGLVDTLLDRSEGVLLGADAPPYGRYCRL